MNVDPPNTPFFKDRRIYLADRLVQYNPISKYSESTCALYFENKDSIFYWLSTKEKDHFLAIYREGTLKGYLIGEHHNEGVNGYQCIELNRFVYDMLTLDV